MPFISLSWDFKAKPKFQNPRSMILGAVCNSLPIGGTDMFPLYISATVNTYLHSCSKRKRKYDFFKTKAKLKKKRTSITTVQ